MVVSGDFGITEGKKTRVGFSPPFFCTLIGGEKKLELKKSF
jgi:hypothetical protein